MSRIKQELDLYVHGRKWYYYLPFLLLTTYFLFEVTQFHLGADTTPLILLPFQMLDFGIHELGHLIFAFAPAVVTAAMGVGTEVLFPLLVVYAAFKYKQYFTGAMCLSWVALAMHSGGQYMADARSQSIPLVSISGDGAIHDWNFVFGKLGLLPQDHVIGFTFMAIGFLLALAGLAFGVFLIVKMAAAADEPAPEADADVPAADVPHGVTLKPTEVKAPSQLYPTALHGRLADEAAPPDAKPTEQPPQ